MGWDVDKTLANENAPSLPIAPGRYYSHPGVNALTTFPMSINTLYAIPILITNGHTATSINIEVTTQSAGNNARLGIYNDASGQPSSLILDCGTVSLTGAGGKTISISVNLPAGWYWLAIVSNGTASVRALSQTNAFPIIGFSSGTDTTTHLGVNVGFTYGALPDPFTDSFTLTSGSVPRVMIGI